MSLIQLFRNQCPVCFEENLSWHYNAKKSQLDVFKCRHYTCKECYLKMQDRFSCPICRSKGQKYLRTFGVVADRPWNTLDEWRLAFQGYIPDNINCDAGKIPKSSFGIIYADLIKKAQQYVITKRKLQQEKIKLEKFNSRKKARALDRKNAVCSKCHTQCTSTTQLIKHMNGSKCIKIQKKVK